MQLPEWLIVVILGVVEGLTEFIPVSSTGHLMVFQQGFGYEWELFTVFIQMGALMAVAWLYREKFVNMVRPGVQYRKNHQLLFHVLIGTLPILVIGFLTRKLREDTAWLIATALIVGGVVIFFVEKACRKPRHEHLEELTWKLALWVGLGQCFALIPGVSRSGATIMTGLILGMSRPMVTEFSFLLALPAMGAATAYELLKYGRELTLSKLGYLFLGTIIAYGVALIVVKWLIRFVQTHTFTLFAWYRLVAGAAILFLWHHGFFTRSGL